MIKNMLLVAATAVASSLSVAYAAPVSGSAYCGISGTYAATSPTLAQLGNAEATSGGLCATFTSNSINFAAGTASNPGTSLASFLSSGGATSTFIAGAATGLSSPNKTDAAGSEPALGFLLDITGTTTLTTGESITLSHDDGALLYFNGVLISPAGGNSQTTAVQSPFTYTGAGGTGTFELIYAANYISPSVLSSNVNLTPAPEPSSLMLLGTGLMSAGGMLFRRRRMNA